MVIKYDDVTEYETHKFVCEASDIGLNHWPVTLETNMGNGRPFIRRSKKVDADGDTMWVTYEQANGCISLRIYND